MRDFRDEKAMAQTLRESLTTKAVTISHSESLELVSKMLGVADWNTLSALLQADHRPGVESPRGEPRRQGTDRSGDAIRPFLFLTSVGSRRLFFRFSSGARRREGRPRPGC